MTSSKIRKLTKDQVIELVKKCGTYTRLGDTLGHRLKLRGISNGSKKAMVKYMDEIGVDHSHLKSFKTGPATGVGESYQVALEGYKKRESVKKRILREGLLPYVCSICDLLPEWKGEKLVLQLDHINGISNDHRLENLRFLCPNCHSQTDTWCGRNRK